MKPRDSTSKDNHKGTNPMDWQGEHTVRAMAYDTAIPGYATQNCSWLRLWKALPVQEFNLHDFNEGNYFGVVENRQKAE